MDLKSNIKEWYEKTFEEKEEELNGTTTFEEVYNYLKDKQPNVYDIIGDVDSVVRERIFAKIADILNVEYDVIYKLWLEVPFELDEEE